MTASANHESGQSRLSQQDLRRIFREGLRRWADYEAEKPAGWLPEDWDSKIDPGLLDRATEVVWDLAGETNANDDALTTAREALEPIIAHGLVRREGRFLRAPAIVKPEMLLDWALWTSLRAMYESYGGDVAEVRCEHWGEEFHLIACGGCTAVFRPRRRVTNGRHCPLCRARPPAPPLGSPNTRRVRRSHSDHGLCARARRQRRHVVEGEGADPLPGVPRTRVRPERRGDVREACMPEQASQAGQDARGRGLKLRKQFAEKDNRRCRGRNERFGPS